MAMTRSASATWQGDLPTGEGTVSTASDFLQAVPTSWRARTEDATGQTSPEELLAAVRRTADGFPVFTPGLAGLVLGAIACAALVMPMPAPPARMRSASVP